MSENKRNKTSTIEEYGLRKKERREVNKENEKKE
jgi:hypothetical protein